MNKDTASRSKVQTFLNNKILRLSVRVCVSHIISSLP